MDTKHWLALQIAGLELELDARDSGLDLAVPFIYEKFLKENIVNSPIPDDGKGSLSVKVRNDPNWIVRRRGIALCLTEIWELWIDENGGYVFISPRQSPPRRVRIDPDFKFGDVVGDFALNQEKGIYPLGSIDIRIVINWLAGFGDLILHAAGVRIMDCGYCFIGEAGVGKSTLTTAISKNKDVTVLGEDQVILRYLDGQFWIFGTPWHERIDMCSSMGVQLKKMFILDRGMDQGIKPFSPSEGITRLLQTAFVPYYLTDKIHLIMDRLSILGEDIPFFTLNYALGSDILPQIVD